MQSMKLCVLSFVFDLFCSVFLRFLFALVKRDVSVDTLDCFVGGTKRLCRRCSSEVVVMASALKRDYFVY